MCVTSGNSNRRYRDAGCYGLFWIVGFSRLCMFKWQDLLFPAGGSTVGYSLAVSAALSVRKNKHRKMFSHCIVFRTRNDIEKWRSLRLCTHTIINFK
jgi:hypothetical protein